MCKHKPYTKALAYHVYWMKLTRSDLTYLRSSSSSSCLLQKTKIVFFIYYSVSNAGSTCFLFDDSHLFFGTMLWLCSICCVLISTYLCPEKSIHMIGIFGCASPINLPSSGKKNEEKKMNNLKCWEHFFGTLIGVSSHHSPHLRVRACVSVCLCACNVCIRSQAIYSIFFSHYYFVQSLHLFLAR